MIEIILVFLLAFFLRTALLFKFKFLGTDTFYHLLRALAIRREGRINELTKNFAKFKELLITPIWWVYYPKFFDIFLSIFPKSFHKNLKFMSAFFDIFVMIALYFFVANFFNSNVALISLFIYAIAPHMILISLPVSPRTFSNLFFVLSNLSLLMFFLSSNYYFIILSAVFVAIIAMTHKLTFQSLIIVFASESIVFKTFSPIMTLILGILFAVLVTKKLYLQILKWHIKFLIFFLKREIDKKKKINELIRTFGSFPMILMIPLIPSVLYPSNSILTYLQTWFLSLFISALVWLWGDSYRYMTYAIFPGSVMFAALISFNNLLLSLLFLIASFLSFFAIANIYISFTKPPKIIDNNVFACFNYIKTRKKRNDILITFPTQYHLAASYFTNCLTLELTKDAEIKEVLSRNSIGGKKVAWIFSDHEISSKHFKKQTSFGSFLVYKSNNKN